MNEKAKEMKRAEKLKKTLGGRGAGSMASATGISSANAHQLSSAVTTDFGGSSAAAVDKPKASLFGAKAPAGGGKALKLGAKATTDDSFLQQLRNEGQAVVTDSLAKVSIGQALR